VLARWSAEKAKEKDKKEKKEGKKKERYNKEIYKVNKWIKLSR